MVEQSGGDPHPVRTNRLDRSSNERSGAEYGKVLATTKLAVNSEEFKRATRRVVIAVGINDYEDKRFNTARAMFEKAVRAYQDDPEPHYYLGKIALETSAEVDKAIAHFEAAITADPQFPPTYRDLGMAQYRKGERLKAIASLERYLVLDPKAKDADQIRATIAELKR
jgi:tetratricopeptide (TPR) repeat protein